ncbi:DUF647-domain-containing protein, partial [Sistotremastrum niveocremeum HHB9708]
RSVLQTIVHVFLPAGYPGSVSEDYLWYQIFDSLQAFTSSIAGMLSSRAVLEGFGVGDATASPTNALILSITQEIFSRLATILFAWRLGTALEPEAKKYRLMADIFNDSSIVLDCLSPIFPGPWRVAILCLSGSLRALCGVAAGGAKAALSVHFAKSGNIGDLNAKDSSQETVIGLMGMLAGTLIIQRIVSPFATWTSLFALLAIHLLMNYFAVRNVIMTSLNQQRSSIVFANFIHSPTTILSPRQVSLRERIFEPEGLLRLADETVIGSCTVGA